MGCVCNLETALVEAVVTREPPVLQIPAIHVKNDAHRFLEYAKTSTISSLENGSIVNSANYHESSLERHKEQTQRSSVRRNYLTS